MNNALFMRCGKGIGQSACNLDDLRDGKAVGRNQAIKWLPIDQLHGEKVDAVGFFDRKDGHDIRVIQRGYGAGFALKAGQALGIMRHSRGEHLDGDVAAETWIAGAKDLSHTAGADGREDFIRAEFVACG